MNELKKPIIPARRTLQGTLGLWKKRVQEEHGYLWTELDEQAYQQIKSILEEWFAQRKKIEEDKEFLKTGKIIEAEFPKPDLPATDWLCECGKRPGDDEHEKWRWDGENWQHHHGYPIGHVIAEYKPIKQQPEVSIEDIKILQDRMMAIPIKEYFTPSKRKVILDEMIEIFKKSCRIKE